MNESHPITKVAPKPKPARASACGKVIIIGEHAVVYGARAVAMPLENLRMTVTLTPTPTLSTSPTIQLKLGGKSVSSHLRSVINDALDLLRVAPFGLTVDGFSQLPIGAGLGSSATLCVAILRGLTECVGMPLDVGNLAKLANVLEERFHGKPSGLDTAVVAHELPIAFTKGSPIQSLQVMPLCRGRNWRFALIDSGIRASTLAMVSLASPYFTSTGGDRRILRFDELSSAVIQGLSSGDLLRVAAAMTEAAIRLEEAGVVTESLKRIMTETLRIGALAAKPTGAGGGGVVLALLDPMRETAQEEQLLKEFGAAKVFFTSLGPSRPDSDLGQHAAGALWCGDLN